MQLSSKWVNFIKLTSAVMVSLGGLILFSSNSLPLKEIKINFLFVTLQLLALYLPLTGISVIIFITALIQERLTGSPFGFYFLVYFLSLLGAVLFIKKNIFKINFQIFGAYILITSTIKIFIEVILMLNIYAIGYIHSYLAEVLIKEGLFNISAAFLIYFLIFSFRRVSKSLYNLFLRFKYI